MSSGEKNAFPPSYLDSIQEASRTMTPNRGQHLLDQLTLVRANHIRSVIDTHILPLVEQQASYGIAQTTIAMLPSDIPLPPFTEEKSEFSFDTSNEQKVEVVGFSSDEEPKIVRLEGQIDKTEFWRPQAVIVELERRLRESLNASPTLRSPTSPRFQSQSEAPQRQPRRNFFSRMADAINQDERSPDRNAEGAPNQMDSAGQVLVRARLEEICLRTVTEFGLYDTMYDHPRVQVVDLG